ncbi:MAG TPA: MBL fold metallo-hydrolase [Baekduia sp.]|uniref:MBL fold metallo-hydrolase n=1 Tax=Baekduia sp. TaxID=2600305 RepID=UPI002BEF3968|nr:MBL fold metallo-hydrolase [Baekduia sp.]HMJ32374.1 MBL fold metallo-hydrolase [Baekduia sp.]
MSDLLAAHDVALVRAGNPGLLTLSGTNTWLVGHDPCWVIDPGPLLEEHVAAVLAAGRQRGGIAGIALTHHHGDHADAADELARRAGGAPVSAARHAGAQPIGEGGAVGPLRAIALPGHAPDHLCFALGTACFTGDAVLGEGSVFIAPDPGALRGYLAGLERLRERGFAVLLPGHGPPVTDVDARLAGYLAHRRDRERRLLAALDAGARSTDALLDAAWDDVPDQLRLAATVTLAAHLDKLEEEGRLPDGVQRPRWD